jgi:hypothetical protein
MSIVSRVNDAGPAPRFTFGTLMNRPADYAVMRDSFLRAGFGEADCEYLVIDNSKGNVADAFSGLNALLDAARGDHIVLCHQDVTAIDSRGKLEEVLARLDAADPTWAVAGNAGGREAGELFFCLTEPHNGEQRIGVFPERVGSVDENLFVVRRATGVRFSHDLAGFHLYGTDICMVADVLGFTSYVIDWMAHHRDQGQSVADTDGYRQSLVRFRAKWNRALRARGVQTTCAFFFVGYGPAVGGLLQPIEKRYYKLAKRRAKSRTRARMEDHRHAGGPATEPKDG